MRAVTPQCLNLLHRNPHSPASGEHKSISPALWNCQRTAALSLNARLQKRLTTKLGYLSVTHENLTDRSFVVRYAVFGYDDKGLRISEGTDQFPIGKHEKVVRQVFLESQASAVSFKLGSMFAIQMFPE
jgi:hypothetical protein